MLILGRWNGCLNFVHFSIVVDMVLLDVVNSPNTLEDGVLGVSQSNVMYDNLEKEFNVE